jgi:hypothetical protein
MLKETERELRIQKIFLTLRIYLTRWSLSAVPGIIGNDRDERDIYTNLRAKTLYGKPNFSMDFQNIISDNMSAQSRQNIGVFVCGPQLLISELRRTCMKMNHHSISMGKVRFYLNKEIF